LLLDEAGNDAMNHRNRNKFAIAFMAVLGPLAATTSSARADEPTGPVLSSWTAAFAYSLLNPDANALGTNDWSCKPSPAHPRPVVLVHGTFENRYDDWAWMAPQIKSAGYCVFALNYGEMQPYMTLAPSIHGVAGIRGSSQQLADFTDQVLVATGATQVDMIGHSQGGLEPRYYMKFLGGGGIIKQKRNKVHALVTLGAVNHGTTVDGVSTLVRQISPLSGTVFGLVPAVNDALAGSEFLQELHAGGDTMPGVHYTVIGSKDDLLSTPYDATFLTAGPGATVDNITLQYACPIDLSSHTSMLTDPRTMAYVLNGLDPAHPVTPPCVPHLPEL